jgi:hypothetical protein
MGGEPIGARTAAAAWDHADHDVVEIDVDRLLEMLASVPLRQIQHATGLSLAACSRIRSGTLRPHERHWSSLAALGK